MSSLPPPISTFFKIKKQEIILDLESSEIDYKDKSPKGNVDVQIIDLIREVNGYEGLVTTSSCAGRVTVFVEGNKGRDEVLWQENQQQRRQHELGDEVKEKMVGMKGGPGGKGGGRWLYVSHDPVLIPTSGSQSKSYFTNLFGLPSTDGETKGIVESNYPLPRLIRLAFSPLILHVSCASLYHARPVLSAAINAGFRESGVQSLKGLDNLEHGAMVAVRTAGLNFETVVGFVSNFKSTEMEDQGQCRPVLETIVTEDYLRLCVQVINERFVWNSQKSEKFRDELRKAIEREHVHSGLATDIFSSHLHVREDKDQRRRRKKEEGLTRQMQLREKRRDMATSDTEGSKEMLPYSKLDEDLMNLETS